jgi:hypothetical protein
MEKEKGRDYYEYNLAGVVLVRLRAARLVLVWVSAGRAEKDSWLSPNRAKSGGRAGRDQTRLAESRESTPWIRTDR